MSGTLFVVATPIGNLGDITQRAIKTLSEVDLIACEDTRHTQKLLNHFGIQTKTISYHEHNEKHRTEQLIEKLKSGNSIAVVSDAGSPAISDPGFRLVRSAIDNDINVVPIPGPSALISALTVAGLPTDEFFFAGFLPAKSSARRTRLQELQPIPATLVFYEAPHRLATTLKDSLDILGEREAVVARELTKLHETLKRGKLSQLVEHYSATEEPRGEIVLLIDRTVLSVADTEAIKSVSELVSEFEAAGMDNRAALKKAARELGLSRAEAYRQLLVQRGRG